MINPIRLKSTTGHQKMPPRNWKDKPQTWEEQFAIHTKVWIKTQGSTNQLGKRQKKEKNESDFNRHLKKKNWRANRCGKMLISNEGNAN